MKSTAGRPRRTTDAQIRLILKWHAEYLAWMAKRPAIPTQRALARHLGISTTAVNWVIHKHQYKQPSPEELATEQKRRRARLREID
ncbi:MAG TPA: hypothetical protein VG963_11070 [Polyangiaceae bacterium]|nr:hypothetical protein [Polyangiaceae bacterium]